MKASKVFIQKGSNPYNTTKKLLKKMKFSVKGKRVLIKPNLTFPSESKSINTDVSVIKAVVERLKNCEILVGDGGYNTEKAFELGGYHSLENVKLVDLNKDKVIKKRIQKPFAFKEIPFAKTVFECDYFINIGKLKVHSLAGVTLSIKNLFGTVVPRRNRVIVHPHINRALADIVQVIKPDFNIIDGVIGNQIDEVRVFPVESEIVLASYDPLSLDFVACECMGIDPKRIEHLILIEKLLGKRSIQIIGEDVNKIKKNFQTRKLLSTKIRYFGERILSKIYNLRKDI